MRADISSPSELEIIEKIGFPIGIMLPVQVTVPKYRNNVKNGLALLLIYIKPYLMRPLNQ